MRALLSVMTLTNGICDITTTMQTTLAMPIKLSFMRGLSLFCVTFKISISAIHEWNWEIYYYIPFNIDYMCTVPEMWLQPQKCFFFFCGKYVTPSETFLQLFGSHISSFTDRARFFIRLNCQHDIPIVRTRFFAVCSFNKSSEKQECIW